MQPGTQIGDYRVEAHVATGGMGEVYRVVHVERGTTHALKYLPLANQKIRKRLVREAELMTKLSHPNVVTLTEVIDVDGDPGLIMEFVDGPSLSRWLVGRLLSLDEAEALFVGIVQGVAHAHRKGLVHRDLKPSNILLARTPDGVVPKVADFGIAKALGAEEHEKLTKSGHSLGSPAYMAPEQIQDAHRVDQRADMFSLGALLYELVCGERAFKGEDTLDVLNAVAQGHFVPPHQIVPELPDRVAAAIEGCLDLRPAERIQDCDELLEILQRGSAPPTQPTARQAASEEPTAPRGPSWSSERTVPRAGRALWEGLAGVLLTAGFLLLALLIGVLGAWLILG